MTGSLTFTHSSLVLHVKRSVLLRCHVTERIKSIHWHKRKMDGRLIHYFFYIELFIDVQNQESFNSLFTAMLQKYVVSIVELVVHKVSLITTTNWKWERDRGEKERKWKRQREWKRSKKEERYMYVCGFLVRDLWYTCTRCKPKAFKRFHRPWFTVTYVPDARQLLAVQSKWQVF